MQIRGGKKSSVLILSNLVLALVLTNCATIKTQSAVKADKRYAKSVARTYASQAAPPQESEDLGELPEIPLPQDKSESAPPQKPGAIEKNLRIPVEMNARVEHWIQYFTVKDRERFQRFLDRGQLYREVVETVLEENDLPAELYYLAMIESGFRTDAHSHAAAVGVWQFIPGTGTRYGLRIDKYVDERRDPIRATEAAAKYLRDLYNVFGSWHLAMAAYNAGEIRILRAVMKGRSRNFWELVEANRLPSETANYVPKFLAVVMIGKEPEKYGFRVTEPKDPYPRLEAVAVPGSVSLHTIAEKSRVSLATVKRVNPHLNYAATPASYSTYELWLPPGAKARIAQNYGNLKEASLKSRPKLVAKGLPKSTPIHIVKPGENLSTIALKHKVSVGHLMRINNMKSSRLFVGAKLRTQAKAYAPSQMVKYKVRRGDNLTILSRRFGTSPAQIKNLNNLKKNQIFVGQILRFAASE